MPETDTDRIGDEAAPAAVSPTPGSQPSRVPQATDKDLDELRWRYLDEGNDSNGAVVPLCTDTETRDSADERAPAGPTGTRSVARPPCSKEPGRSGRSQNDFGAEDARR